MAIGKTVSVMALALLLTSMSTVSFNIQPAIAEGGFCIRADGSIEPPTAPIFTSDNVTYILTGNVTISGTGPAIVIERDNIVFDGAGYTVQGPAHLGADNGIVLLGRSNVTIKNAKISGFYSGIVLSSSSCSNISGNDVTANVGHGITFYTSSNNSIFGNNITNNWWVGFMIADSSDNNSIVGNNITANNDCGIFLSESFGNTFSANSITNNYRGIWFYWQYSSGNRFFHNNFINNTQQAPRKEPGHANIWDNSYPSGGNYWSDYNGTDLFSGPFQNETGCDGIGDTPCVIDSSNQDNYPLMDQMAFLIGDVTRDGYVGIDDLFEIALHFGAEIGQPRYSRACDITYDGYIGVDDLFITASHFGEQENP